MPDDTEAKKYTPDNWAHQALLKMDDAEALVRFAAVSMPDAVRYNQAAEAFWDVCKILADQRDKLHNSDCTDPAAHPAARSE